VESLIFIGALFRIVNLWNIQDAPNLPAVHYLSEIKDLPPNETDRPITIDIFITTINEQEFIVEETIIEAKRQFYPYPDVPIHIYLLDDGKRDGTDIQKENFNRLAQRHQIHYLSRETNEGFKAGNLNNGIKNSSGDLFVILDADSRPFTKFLYHTTGYFRNKKTAWVQTPQWFKDISSGTSLAKNIEKIFTGNLSFIPNWYQRICPNVKVGEDILCSSPTIFYDTVLRRKYSNNGVFNCGAGSINRRDAILDIANERLKNQGIDRPLEFHISEDLFNSILIHSGGNNKWESSYHPRIECSMLSPQDLSSWIKQQKRYASGTIDITLSKYNPLFIKGLSFFQRIAYIAVMYSYITPPLSIILFILPIIYFYLNLTYIDVSASFLLLFTLYQLGNILVFKTALWGINTKRFDQKFWSSFFYVTQSWIKVIFTRTLSFDVTPKKSISKESHLKHIIPHLIIIISTFIGILLYPFIYKITTNNILPYLFYSILGIYHIYQLNTFVRAAFHQPHEDETAIL
jgi:cellulose synthase (UDP-forming)